MNSKVTPLASRKRPVANDGDVALYDSNGRPRKQADVLIELAARHVLFRSSEGDTFAEVQIGDHREVHPVESKIYREILAEYFFAATAGKAGCNRNAIADAVTTLAARARFQGEVRPVWLRVARHDGELVFDAGDDAWSTLTIDSLGYETGAGGGVMFRRTGRMLALPTPKEPADFGRLWNYIGAAKEDRVLIAAFLLGALRPDGPYPLLALSGEQGSGKSTVSKIIKRLVDPSAAPLSAPPKDVRDLLVSALNRHLLVLDNLSWLPPEVSDALCRISTGGAIAERTLYSNTDETLVGVQRPVILNGIEELASRPDLAQRAIHIELPQREDTRTEAEVWAAFEQDAPHIFAGLLNGLCGSLRDADSVKLSPMPRMADFAVWAAAGVPWLGFTADEFITAYRANQDAGLAAGADGSAVGRAALHLMEDRREWSGTASELLAALEAVTADGQRGRTWPKSARALSAALNRLGPALRACGVGKVIERSGAARTIHLSRSENSQ